jgi:hypothetical protein
MTLRLLWSLAQLLQGLLRLRERYWAQTGLTFELLTLALALAVGLLILPLLIWIAGRISLGDYTNGGPLGLYADYIVGLARGGLSYWVALLGPYGFLLLARAMRGIWRRV